MWSVKNKMSEKLESSVEEQFRQQTGQRTEEELFSLAGASAEEQERTGYSNYSYWRSTLQAFGKNRVAVFLVFVIVGILLFTFIQPLLPGQHDPNMVNNDSSGMQYRNVPPGSQFWFGTNSIGQDLWARIWAGTRNSLFIGFAVAGIEAFIGIVAGVLWGYVRKLDALFTEIYNVLDNIPQTIVLILISYILKPGVKTLIFAMCLTGWIQMARFIRNQVLMLRDREYNLASRCLGTPISRVLVKNIFPYLISVIILRLALSIPGTIALESTLSYLGLGLGAATPSLGLLLRNARNFFLDYPYLLIEPAVIVSLITVTFYLVGNAVSDAADPRNHV